MGELQPLLRGSYSAQLKVAIDIDGTLAAVHGMMITAYNKIKGTNFTVEDIKDWGFKSIGSTYAEMMLIYVDIWRNRWRDIPFTVDINQISALTNYYLVHLLTSRSASEGGLTGGTTDALNEWREIHGIGEDKIHLVICPPTKDKATSFDYDVYIDDSPGLARSIQHQARRARMLLVDSAYNRHIEDGKGVTRVTSAGEAIRILINLARTEKTKARLR
ncbi:MAG: 5' nucleotidase, NT5C type [Candidatus Micrarchaeaceae archaeon]